MSVEGRGGRLGRIRGGGGWSKWLQNVRRVVKGRYESIRCI